MTAIAALIAARIRDVPDFPSPGILFKDIVALLADGEAFGAAIAALAECARGVGSVDIVAGVEARGFIVGGALAGELGCGFVPVRKVGKLPPPTLQASYSLEYGSAEIEIPFDVLRGRRVYLVDDVLATGGTLEAAGQLVARGGGQVIGIGVLLELAFLQGRSRSSLTDVHALLTV